MVYKFKFLVLIGILTSWTPMSGQYDVERLVTKMLGESPIEEDLQELCDEIGGRVTGSATNQKAVQWAYDKFHDLDIPVIKEKFTMPSLWLEQSTEVSVPDYPDFKPLALAKYQSPPGIYQGRLVFISKGSELDFEENKESIKGNFVFVETDICLDINGLFAEYAHAYLVEQLAEKYEALGIVFMSSRPGKLLYRFLTSKMVNNDSPQLIMARDDAKRCIRLIQNGHELNINCKIKAEIGGEFESHNIIAEIKGSEKPEEVILIGAHLDSWALGTGANDNGCNVSMMIDIARQIKLLGIRPKRTIRFALWNGEEQGYFGSWAYTQQHQEELDNHKMTLSVDIGSGDITGFFTNGRDELFPMLEKVLQPVVGLAEFSHLNSPIIGTDNLDFMLEGVPNLVANHKPQLYGPTYHAANDTYDKVDLKSLKRNSAIVAALTMGMANLKDEELNIKRHSRKEVEEIADKFQLEFPMRMFDVWEIWRNMARGRIE